MWFDPDALSKNETNPLATSATFATFEEKIPKTETQSRKVAIVAEGARTENKHCYLLHTKRRPHKS